MKEYRREPPITFVGEADERNTRKEEIGKPSSCPPNSRSAAPIHVIRPNSLTDYGPPISSTSAKVDLQLLITTIQDTVLSHERALRLIGSRMPLFDAMDEMKEWLKTKGKHAADEDYDWCRNKLHTLFTELEQMTQRAETALKEFHELRQSILRSVTGISGDGPARTRLRPDQEAEMRRLLENTDRWFQQFPHNLPQGKKNEVMQPPLELFIKQLQVIKETHDSIVNKSKSMKPTAANLADFQPIKEARDPLPARSEPQLLQTRTWQADSQPNKNVRETIPRISDAKLPSTTLQTDAQLMEETRDLLPTRSEPQLLQTKSGRMDLRPVNITRDTIPTSAEPEVPPPITRSSLHRPPTLVNESSSRVNADKEYVIIVSRSELTAREPEVSRGADSEKKRKSRRKTFRNTENKRNASESSDSEYAHSLTTSFQPKDHIAGNGEQGELPATSTGSPMVADCKPIVDQKEYVTVEAQTRILSRALTLDASSDHHQKPPDQTGHVSIKTPPETLVKNEPVTPVVRNLKKSANRVLIHEDSTTKEEEESNSKTSKTSCPTVTLSMASTPVPEEKKASFRILGWQWNVNDQNKNVNNNQPNTFKSGVFSLLPFATPLSNLLELIRNHESSIWKQTKKLVLTKYVYDGPGYPPLHGVNKVLQRLWTDAEFYAFPKPPQERLKEKLEEIEGLQSHLVDLYSNPKLVRELRTIIEQYKGSSRLSLDSMTSELETCSQWLKAKSKEVRKEYAEMYRLIREDTNAYKHFLIESQSVLHGALDEFLGTLDEPEISIKTIRESEAESSVGDYQTLREAENWKLPRFRLRNACSMYIDNTTSALARKQHGRIAWKISRAYTN